MTRATPDGRKDGYAKAVQNAHARGMASEGGDLNPYRRDDLRKSWQDGRDQAAADALDYTRTTAAGVRVWVLLQHGEFTQRVFTKNMREALRLARILRRVGWHWDIGWVGHAWKYSSRLGGIKV